MPTGTGKTEVMIAAVVSDQCKRTCVIVPSNLLRRQTIDRFCTLGKLEGKGNMFRFPKESREAIKETGRTMQRILRGKAADRLIEAREYLDLSQLEFAKSLGVPVDAVADWESGKKSPSDRMMKKIEAIHAISSKWVQTGHGDVWVQKVSKLELSPSQNARDAATIPLVILRPSPDSISVVNEEPVEPAVRADASTQPEAVHISGAWLKQHIGIPIAQLFMTVVNGDSMAPALGHNDVVIVDRSALQAGFRDGVWVFRLGDAIHVKRVQQTGPAQYQATCDNPSYSPIALTEDFHLIGRVVWSFKSW